MVDKRVPELRFEGFDGDWEQRKLGEVFQQTVEYIDPKEAGLELWSVTVENGLTPKSERYNREFLVKKNDKFKAIHPDEIVYNPMNMTLGSIGFNNSGKDVAVSGYYVTMKLNEGFDTKYFATWLPSPNAINLYKLYATGSLIERQRVQFPTLSGITTLMPILNEQKQIGLFFKQLDTTTALHQQKLDQLKRLKQSFLQILFGNKEQAPKVRFAGFDEEWEQRKLRDSIKVMDGDRGSNYPHDSDFFENGDTLFLDTGNVTKNGFKFDSVKYITKEKDEQLRSGKLEKNDFVLTSRGTLGNVGFYDELVYKLHPKLRINSAMLILRNTDKQLSYSYLHTLLKGKLISDFMRKNQVGSAQPHITKSEFLKLDLNVPCGTEEQNKVGEFFKNLDHTINLHQTKLEKLKQLKQAFLQKMFI
ncbi:restriction endonuclease subunit S [Enterococcus thailandicus]|uniref:restriction endonuclease subunit S n=2 Tax=Enterococcus thailandicus TaxID=417368 RepID=UPI0022DFEDBB|nr:restriction endonuclease subunit S [Enterococcus thailandicus]